MTPSSFVAKYAEEIARTAPGPIVDVACGYGRNAACIASYGIPVVCLDKDIEVLASIDALGSAGEVGLQTRRIDLILDPWPCDAVSLGAIVGVHWSFELLVAEFVRSLKPSGLLLLESIGGQGRNHLSLPNAGFFEHALGDAFDVRYLRERRVGPPGSNAAASKLFAKRRFNSNDG